MAEKPPVVAILPDMEVEKKYRVSSFGPTLAAIERLGAQPTIEVRSTHYYAHLDTDDTLKMVAQQDGPVEIHRLSTKNGLHTLEENIPVTDVEAGLAWFKDHGYHTLDTLDMHNREYAYGNGGLALYTIDGAVRSVILGYPEAELSEMEPALGLTGAEQITVPYNKYLASLGMLRSIDI